MCCIGGTIPAGGSAAETEAYHPEKGVTKLQKQIAQLQLLLLLLLLWYLLLLLLLLLSLLFSPGGVRTEGVSSVQLNRCSPHTTWEQHIA